MEAWHPLPWRPLAAAAALVVLMCGCGHGAVARRGNGSNLLLVTIETTRADHLGAYGYARRTSPRFDHLAEVGTLFEHASTVSPRTNPALASLMTSLYPHQHGVRNLLLPLNPENRTLAEILRDAGYLTGAVQTHYGLNAAASGFAQGFDTYDDLPAPQRGADEACRVAVKWLDEAVTSGRPWFLWVHLLDPHWTYDPPAALRTLFGPDDPRPFAVYRDVASGRLSIGSVIFENRMPRDEVDAFVRLYDAEIRFADASMGMLLDRLDALDVSVKTVVVAAADHGESLGEHRYFFEHGDFGMEPEIHIPLVLVAPDRVPAGLRVPWAVRSIDVLPTVLELLDLPAETQFRGASLMPLVRDPQRGEDRPCFGEVGKKFHPENSRREVEGVAGKWRWLKRGRFKLVWVPRATGVAERRLYDLQKDPGETRDVLAEFPEEGARLGQELEAWMAEKAAPEPAGQVTPELLEELRSLGYVN